MSKVVTFHCDTAEVKVSAIGKFREDREPHPFSVTIVPASILLSVETIKVNEPYYFLAAQTALDEYKEKRGLDSSETWNL